MPVTFALKPTHKAVRAYYLALAQLANVGAKHETALRETWHNLIEAGAGPLKWTLVREYAISRRDAAPKPGYTQADVVATHIYVAEEDAASDES